MYRFFALLVVMSLLGLSTLSAFAQLKTLDETCGKDPLVTALSEHVELPELVAFITINKPTPQVISSLRSQTASKQSSMLSKYEGVLCQDGVNQTVVYGLDSALHYFAPEFANENYIRNNEHYRYLESDHINFNNFEYQTYSSDAHEPNNCKGFHAFYEFWYTHSRLEREGGDIGRYCRKFFSSSASGIFSVTPKQNGVTNFSFVRLFNGPVSNGEIRRYIEETFDKSKAARKSTIFKC